MTFLNLNKLELEVLEFIQKKLENVEVGLHIQHTRDLIDLTTALRYHKELPIVFNFWAVIEQTLPYSAVTFMQIAVRLDVVPFDMVDKNKISDAVTQLTNSSKKASDEDCDTIWTLETLFKADKIDKLRDEYLKSSDSAQYLFIKALAQSRKT